MPHIIVEYSSNIEQSVNVPEMLSEMHDALASEGIDKARIKTRGVSLAHSVVGDNKLNVGAMAHITLLLLEGRDVDTKKLYSKAVHTIAQQYITKTFPDGAVTMEVRDMSAETYIL